MFRHLPLAIILLTVPTVPLAAASADEASNSLGGLPLNFIENRGQVPVGNVAYYVKGGDRTLFFTPEGITFAIDCGGNHAAERWAVKLGFVGADPDVAIAAGKKQKAVFGYFKGKPEDWKAGIPAYGQLVYEDLWPGIDLVYSGYVNELKYEFVVEPGADPASIRLEYGGIEAVAVDDSGNLVVNTPAGALEDGAPVAFQLKEGRKVEVRARYSLHGEPKNGTVRYGFDVGKYDPCEPLIIDPSMLVYCGFIGGSGGEQAHCVAVDGGGNVYLTGYTQSSETSFPVTAGPDLAFNGGAGDTDAFVAKVDAQGAGLVYCGYIGGSNPEAGFGIAVDAQGNAYVAGSTHSSETSFPVTGGPDLTFNCGVTDAFVAKINAQGTALEYCGYIGGTDFDKAYGIAVDAQGNAYVTGYTWSTAWSFPVAVGPFLTSSGGDAFVARVNAQGTGLDYCGYIGGDRWEEGKAIAVDAQGNAYVAGYTYSKQDSFPVTVGPDLTFNSSSSSNDAFVAKVAAGGATLDYCGYIGGERDDLAYGIAVDGEGNAYVTGDVKSDQDTFPVAVGPDLTFNGVGYKSFDAFVAKVDAQGTALDYCGYIGGFDSDHGYGIAVDGQGNAYVCGEAASTESSFPVVVGPDLIHNGGDADGFVAKVDADGAILEYCGYIGGDGIDGVWSIATDAADNVYVAGHTGSTEASFPVGAGPDLTYNGGDCDAFIAKLSAFDAPVPDIKVNGDDGPLNLTTLDTVTVTIHLDPRSLDGELADWWVAAKKVPSSNWWARYRPGQMPKWTKLALPARFAGAALRTVGGYTVLDPRTLPAGQWLFGFSIDDNMDNIYDASFIDTAEVNVN